MVSALCHQTLQLTLQGEGLFVLRKHSISAAEACCVFNTNALQETKLVSSSVIFLNVYYILSVSASLKVKFYY